MREIDINTILKVLKKRFIVLIIIAILTSLISGFYYTSQSKPVYSSKATFLLDRQPIIIEKDGKQEITYPMTQKELIEVSIALIKTDDIAERIIVNAGYTGDISPSDFGK